MNVCPQCGEEFADDLRFCQRDGTPLVSKEADLPPDDDAEIGEKTVVMGGEPPVGEETLVMSDVPELPDETVAIPQDDLSETDTVVPADTGDDQGSETVPGIVDDDADDLIPDETMGAGAPADEEFVTEERIPAVPDDTVFTSDAVEPDDAGGWDTSSSDEGEEWTGAAAVSAEADWDAESDSEGEDEDEPAAVAAEPDSADSKSRIALVIVGIVFIFGFFAIAAGAIAVWWYTSSRGAEVATTTGTPEATTPFPDELPPADDTLDGNANTNDLANSEFPVNAPANDGAAGDSNRESRPSPSPVKTPRRSTPTPRIVRTPVRSPVTGRPTRTPTPRPTRTPRPAKTPFIPGRVSRGVVNGQAVSLPKPSYPAVARAANARGRVRVRVIIGKTGRVISATAVSGHPLLRRPSVRAARRARFRPTLLSGQPVEVSGVIVYNFQ